MNTVTAMDFPAGRFYVSLMPWAVETLVFDEDGRNVVLESWRIWVTNNAGRRWEAEEHYVGRIEYDEEEGHPIVVGGTEARDQALGVAKSIAQRLTDGMKLDAELWREIDPEYGSEAYQRGGYEQQRADAERSNILWA